MDIKKQLQLISFVSFPLSFIPMVASAYILVKSLPYINTSEDWKYLCAFVGFVLFTSVFLYISVTESSNLKKLRKQMGNQRSFAPSAS
jgi:hypothetical protein